MVRVLKVAVIVLASLSLWLGAQSRTLRQQRAEAVQRAVEPFAGLYVPAFTAVPIGGQGDLTIAGPEQASPQLLLIFTTTCPYCEASLPAWKRLAEELGKYIPGQPVIGISLDPLEETERYVAKHDIEFPVVRFPDQRTRSLYRTRSVPLMLVADTAGRLLFSRIGVVDGRAVVDSVLTVVRAGGPSVYVATDSLVSPPR